jgi:acetyltransferase-like isoleucine patch superfamily enzyme
VLAGSVQVGKMTMIGTGSVIIPEVVVGDSQMVKAGMVVTKSMA